jgi:hypothetical protein
MNRAKQIMLGARTNVETTEYTKKSINKAIREIEDNEIEIDELRNRVKKDLTTDNTFLKNIKSSNDENSDNSGDDILSIGGDELIDDTSDEIDEGDIEDDFVIDEYVGDTDNVN